MTYTLRPYQQEAVDAAVRFFHSKTKGNAIEVLPTGCHAKGTQILMADGSTKLVENIVVGDSLLGDDGTPRKVLGLHRGGDKMYKITPIKGDSFIVNGGHILSLYRTRQGYTYNSDEPGVDEVSVSDYLQKSKNYKHLHKLRRPAFVDFHQNEALELPPYFLGLYLGDGSSSAGSVNITTMREEVKDYLYSFVENIGMRVTINWKGGNNKASTYNLVGEKRHRNYLQESLIGLGLLRVTCGSKFIPHKYKTSAKENRLELLAGLLDTDAYYDSVKNTYEYSSKSKRLMEDIVFVCRSLGLFARIGKPMIINGETYYRMQISGDCDKIPTRVSIRKAGPRRQKKSVLVTGFAVEYVGEGDYYGFTLDGNHLYCDNQFFIHHNSGKSLVIANIANRLEGNTLVFQPSKEILEQNFYKLCSYGVMDCSIYSASMNQKRISRITFATIGSVIGRKEDFKHFDNVIIDECHLVNAKGGMYEEFISKNGCKVLGLTATPYRLSSSTFGSMLKFLTRTRPRIFKDVIYQVQIKTLLDMGFLADLDYYSVPPPEWNKGNLVDNSTGADYTDKSVQLEYKRVDLYGWLVKIVKRLLSPKGRKRNGILVFTRFLTEAECLTNEIEGCEMVSGNTSKGERERILEDFKTGKTKVVVNVGVLTTGFDYPDLDTIVMARPTKSLSLWYQIVGRAIRPSPNKDKGWIVDLCGNIDTFGKVSDLRLEEPRRNMWQVVSNGKQLTNVYF